MISSRVFVYSDEREDKLRSEIISRFKNNMGPISTYFESLVDVEEVDSVTWGDVGQLSSDICLTNCDGEGDLSSAKIGLIIFVVSLTVLAYPTYWLIMMRVGKQKEEVFGPDGRKESKQFLPIGGKKVMARFANSESPQTENAKTTTADWEDWDDLEDDDGLVVSSLPRSQNVTDNVFSTSMVAQQQAPVAHNNTIQFNH